MRAYSTLRAVAPARPGGRGPWPALRAAHLGRTLWALMLVAHLPAWLASCRLADPAGVTLLRWGLLTASEFFFLLKLLDVPWLRLPRSGRARLAAVVAVGLLHAHVVARAAGAARPDAPLCAVLALSGAATLSGTLLARGQRVHEDARPGRAGRPGTSGLPCLRAVVWAWLLPPRWLLLARACPICRAPPR